MTVPSRLLFFALFPFASAYLLSYLLRAVNAVVAPELVREFGLGPAELGLLTSAYLLTFSAFQLPLGVLLDRYGARRVQTVLLLIAALGAIGFALAQNFIGLFIARAVFGLGFSAGLMAGYKSSATWVPMQRRALANTTIMSMGALGLVLATEPTAVLSAAVGWRNVFLILAALVALSAAFIFVAVPEKPDAAVQSSFVAQWREAIGILKLPLFWRVAPLLGLASGIPISYQTLWAGPWFRDVMGFGPNEVARSLLWMAGAFMVGIFSAGVLADRLQRRGITPLQTMLGLLGVHMVAQLIIVLQVKVLALPAWLVLAGVGQVAVLAFPWFASRVGEHLAGRANATINFAMFVAAFAAQYGVGLVIAMFAPVASGYDARAYIWAFGLLLSLQFAAFIWYLAGRIQS